MWIEDVRKKLQDCHRYLDEKRQAYEIFDRFSTVSEDPYSLQARTMDSRSDRSIIQWLDKCERGIPKTAQDVHSIDDLIIKCREVHNFWTDLWEAVQRARVRAKIAEHEHYALMRKKTSSKPGCHSEKVSLTGLPHISQVSLSNSGSSSEFGSESIPASASASNPPGPETPSQN